MSRTTFWSVLATGAIIALGACAPAPKPAHAPEPAACADSLYVSLRRQHPDSLSERAWQRLLALDRECAAARIQTMSMHDGGMMGMRHGGGWGLLGLATIAVMVVMMSALR